MSFYRQECWKLIAKMGEMVSRGGRDGWMLTAMRRVQYDCQEGWKETLRVYVRVGVETNE